MNQILKQLNLKEMERKEAVEEAMKIRCVTCFRETAPKRLCGGHGGGGGGDSSAAGSESGKGLDYDSPLSAKSDEIDEDAEDLFFESDLILDGEEIESQEEENRFDPQIITKMVEDGLLEVINDRNSKTLSINLLVDPKTLTKEQRQEFSKYVNAILEELKAFMEKNNLSDDCLTIVQDEKGNIKSFTFKAPTLAIYDAFIEQLANNLVPLIQAEEEQSETFNPSPFSMKMKPW